jgi:hypothetical protein
MTDGALSHTVQWLREICVLCLQDFSLPHLLKVDISALDIRAE